jgi:hypothetical protein
MLGERVRFDTVPFFWSNHYDDVAIGYTGHAESWDKIEFDGDMNDGDCAVRYFQRGKLLAIATMGRDRENLQTERAMEEATHSG